MQAQPGIDRQVAHQSRAVGVVAQQRAVSQFAQSVYGAGALRPFGQGIGQAIGLFLERHGHVGATAVLEELTGTGGEVLQRREHRAVVQLLAGLGGEQTVNQRRFAVADGVAEHDITVHHTAALGAATPSQSRSCRK